jgi:hypothetical protein
MCNAYWQWLSCIRYVPYNMYLTFWFRSVLYFYVCYLVRIHRIVIVIRHRRRLKLWDFISCSFFRMRLFSIFPSCYSQILHIRQRVLQYSTDTVQQTTFYSAWSNEILMFELIKDKNLNNNSKKNKKKLIKEKNIEICVCVKWMNGTWNGDADSANHSILEKCMRWEMGMEWAGNGMGMEWEWARNESLFYSVRIRRL